ncbi:hypothetical protein [Salinactinospora qingdaonensis]|uniref:Uncharacterized protein n=1 Tax=Salinactinospora qingdaonensis TaxID=702744 RepID=A0ABP7FJN6_9ACTN
MEVYPCTQVRRLRAEFPDYWIYRTTVAWCAGYIAVANETALTRGKAPMLAASSATELEARLHAQDPRPPLPKRDRSRCYWRPWPGRFLAEE